MITKLSCLDFGTQPDSVRRLSPDPVSESEIGSDNILYYVSDKQRFDREIVRLHTMISYNILYFQQMNNSLH